MKIIKDINVEKVLFTLPEKDEDGYYISRCEYDKDKEGMYWLLRNVNIDDTFTDEDEIIVKESKNKDIFDQFVSLDKKIVQEIEEKSEEWFGKKLKKEVVQRNYKTLLKENFVDEALLTIPLERTEEEQELTFDIYNHKKELVDETELEFPLQIHTLLNLRGLRFTRSKVEPIWYIIQIKVLKKLEEKVQKKCLIDDEN
jgi:hypothetical protein